MRDENMSESKTEEKQSGRKKEPGDSITIEGRIILLFIGFLIIGFAGYFALHDFWVRYVFAHIGGLAIIGILGYWAGRIAKKKGYRFWKAFLFGFGIPVILGVFSVFLVHILGGRACGGSVSIFAALVVVICYFFVKRRDAGNQINP